MTPAGVDQTVSLINMAFEWATSIYEQSWLQQQRFANVRYGFDDEGNIFASTAACAGMEGPTRRSNDETKTESGNEENPGPFFLAVICHHLVCHIFIWLDDERFGILNLLNSPMSNGSDKFKN